MNYFKEMLKHISGQVHSSSPPCEILKHLIMLIGEKNFNTKIEVYFVNDNSFYENFHDFHKSMRQTDFYELGEGHLDMIFWEFIHMSEIPYNIFKSFIDKIKENVPTGN